MPAGVAVQSIPSTSLGRIYSFPWREGVRGNLEEHMGIDHGTNRDAWKKRWMCTWHYQYLRCTNGVFVRNGCVGERARLVLGGRGRIG